ncbi:ABC transporter permease [Actinoalloteichus spitiensis]|uniref:ABC transporter permease n=1 Tax=Actinoalloteichus spitiensis TaxID=252394 RepID=UPI0002FC864F|nr:ABC transporter permease [Actinoalloteichus spitiensis]
MLRYIIRRILISIPILGIGSFLAYLLVSAAGNPIGEYRATPGVTEEDVQNLMIELGLDRPIWARYWDWLTGFLTGDWGESLALGSAKADVYEEVMRAFSVTFRLVIGAEILAIVLGVAIGVLAAVRQYTIFDYVATTAAFVMFSMPLFCVAIVLKMYGIRFNDLLVSMGGERWIRTIPPAQGFQGSFFEQVSQYVGVYLLPTLSLMLISFAAYSRFQRASMLETLGSDYVRTARAKGLRPSRVIFRHAFRNALIPVTTMVSLNFSAVLGGAIMTEMVFGWRGMGSLLVDAVGQKDPPMLMGWLMVTAVLTVAFNLVADIVYGFLDPRIRLG